MRDSDCSILTLAGGLTYTVFYLETRILPHRMGSHADSFTAVAMSYPGMESITRKVIRKPWTWWRSCSLSEILRRGCMWRKFCLMNFRRETHDITGEILLQFEAHFGSQSTITDLQDAMMERLS